jgi:hypothetical protein
MKGKVRGAEHSVGNHGSGTLDGEEEQMEAQVSELAPKAVGRRRLTAAGMVLAWCVVVAIAATAGWLVVDRAGISLLGASGPGLSGGVGAGAAATTSAAAPPGATASLTTTGGRVTVTCTPAGQISQRSATPAQGWAVEMTPTGGTRLTVEFTRSGRSVEVHGACRAGVAVLTRDVPGKDAGSGTTATSAPGGTTDDHGGTTKGGSGSSGGSGSGSSGGSGKGSGSSGGSGKGGGSDDSGSDH